MANNHMYGGFNMGLKWTPGVLASAPDKADTNPFALQPDPNLPAFTVDPIDKTIQIVIPAGRFVSYGLSSAVSAGSENRRSVRDAGENVLTLHDGSNLSPAGILASPMSKRVGQFMVDENSVPVYNGVYAKMPYVVAVNDAYGALRTGHALTGYFGSTTSSTQKNYAHVGKQVKWIGKKLYMQTASASATVVLEDATLPAYQPRHVSAQLANQSHVTTGATSFAFTSGAWRATYGQAVTGVLFEYGPDADQIAGEVVEVRSVTNMIADDPFLKYVEAGSELDIPPAMQKVPVTSVSNETPSTVVAGRKYQLANAPLSVHHAVTVQITGTIVDSNGNATEYSDWTTLSSGTDGVLGNFMGTYYNINWLTGVIELSSNILASGLVVRVSYSYITDPNHGAVKWAQGIHGLTDGDLLTASTTYGGTNVVPADPVGVEAHLNYAGVIGQLMFWVKG